MEIKLRILGGPDDEYVTDVPNAMGMPDYIEIPRRFFSATSNITRSYYLNTHLIGEDGRTLFFYIGHDIIDLKK